MKLCTFQQLHSQEKTGPGLLLGEPPHSVVGLARLARLAELDLSTCMQLEDMQTLLEGGPALFEQLRQLLHHPRIEEATLPLNQVRLLAPLVRPRSMRDCMAFREHFQQALRGGAAMKYPLAARADAFLRKFLGIKLIRVPKLFGELPVYYKGNPASVVGTGAVVEWPAYSSLLDYELEVAVVIHRQGRDLSEAEVRDCIGGYLIFNDFSARDAQVREMDLRLGPAKGKDFDTGNSLGPWLVTPDEVGDLRLLRAQARVNGELWTDSSLSSLEFSVERILSYISQAETLYPGDVIGLGTVPNGCGMEHGRWLKDGDLVELSVDRLGTLSNRVRRRS